MSKFYRSFREFHLSGKKKTSSSLVARGQGPSASRLNPQGLDIVAEGIEPIVDIVFIHGLNGHREKTWTAANGVNWIHDLLPEDIPNARILCWGYDANTHSNLSVSCQYLYDHARSLVSDLCLQRQLSKTQARPLIFIAHSLGGIIVKSALIHSDAARQDALEEHRSIRLSTYGIFFMGTPHQGGSGVKLGRFMVNIASLFVSANDRLLKHLERDSEWLQQQLGLFGPMSGDFVTKFAFEEFPTSTALGHSIMVVPRTSAVVPGAVDAEIIGIHADHRNMVRFTSKQDAGYRTVSGHLRIMTGNASEVVRLRWDTERRINEARTHRPLESFSASFSLSEVSEVEHFVAREEELTDMRRYLRHNGSRRTVVLHGLGGMGKTQLAIAYAKRHKTDYSAIIWLNSKDEASPKQSFMKAAKRISSEHPSSAHLAIPSESEDVDGAVDAVKRWLNDAKNNAWLLIYDDYDNPNFGDTTDPRAFDIRFLPETHHGAVIITTRSFKVKLGDLLHLRKLQNTRDSLEILIRTSRRHGLENDPDALKLVQEVDGLPLALAAAGSFLDQVSISVTEYLQLYQNSWLKLQYSTPKLLSYEDRALYSTWALSLEHVKHRNELSAKLLQLWAYFDNQDLWFELLNERSSGGPEWFSQLTEDELSFHEAARVLCDHGLVEADALPSEHSTESRGYSMHTCVHSWTIHVLNSRWDLNLATLALQCVGLHVPDGDPREYWVMQRRLTRHANRCFEHAVSGKVIEDHNKLTLESISGLGILFKDQGKLSEAVEMCQRSIRGYEAALGPEDESTLNAVDTLGSAYMRQGKLVEAEEVYQRVLQVDKKKAGADGVFPFSTMNNLGIVYWKQSRFEESEAMLLRALQGKEKEVGPGEFSTLSTINNLGILYERQGKLVEAEKMHQRALHRYQELRGPDHPSTLNTVCNLGIVYERQGKLAEAEEMFKKTLQGFEKWHLLEDPVTYIPALNALYNLGHLYGTTGNWEQAGKMFQRALDGYQALWGSDHEVCRDILRRLSPRNKKKKSKRARFKWFFGIGEGGS